MESASRNKPAIVCVDDEPAVLQVISAALERAFSPAHEVIAISTGQEALITVQALLRDGRDLPAVVTDQAMPGLSGEEFVAHLRELSPETQPILLSGHATADLLGRMVNQSGLFRFLQKPCDIAELVSAVREADRAYFQRKELHHLQAIIHKPSVQNVASPEAEGILLRQRVLLELSLLNPTDFDERMRAILERTAHVLDADAACFLRTSPSAEWFECTHLYGRDDGRHSSPRTVALAADHPEYAAAISAGEIVAVRDATIEPLAASITTGLRRFSARASLDVPVWLDGRLAGVLRHECAGAPRDWCREDIDFTQLAAQMIASSREAAQRRKTEARLRQAEERYRGIFENAVVGIYQSTESGRLLACNSAMASLLGFNSPEELRAEAGNLAANLYVDPGHRNRFLERLHKEGTVADFECALRRRDGQIVFVSESARAVRDESHRTLYLEGIVKDVTPRVRAMRELKLAKEAAEEANRAKSAFLATMSHEIRTPLSGVIGMLDILLRSPLHPEQDSCARLARQSAESLLAIINDVLDFSKIESGRLDIAETPVDLRDLLSNLVALETPKAAAKGLGLEWQVDPEVPDCVLTDPVRVRQVFSNLLSNGIKFTETGGVRLDLQCESEDSGGLVLRARVEDTGIGIPSSALDRIFLEFEQADNTTTRRFGGTGLGLAICRSLVDRMGGRIWAESEPGRGSRFNFSWRVQPCLPSEHPRTAPDPAPAIADRALALLCVEDSLANQAITRILLSQMGHSVHVASNGREAVELLCRNPYDAVLLDIHMPVMDGVGTARVIRDPASAVIDHGIYLIAVTADASPSDRERYLAAGMDDYLSKPVTEDVLRAALARAAARLGPRPTPPAPTPHPQTSAEALWPLFAAETASLLRRMHAASAEGDAAGLAEAAHTIKGSAASFGFSALSRVCAAIETEARATRLSAMTEWIRQADAEFDRLQITRLDPAPNPENG